MTVDSSRMMVKMMPEWQCCAGGWCGSTGLRPAPHRGERETETYLRLVAVVPPPHYQWSRVLPALNMSQLYAPRTTLLGYTG